MAEELRLQYYNDYLLEQGVITKRDHAAMNLAILKMSGGRRRGELGERSFEDRLSTAGQG